MFHFCCWKESEKKECVLREYFGRNFFSLFRTCHSDRNGGGWYLTIDEQGKVSSTQVEYSDQQNLHFIVKISPEISNTRNINSESTENLSFQILDRKESPQRFSNRWRQHVPQGERRSFENTSSTPSPQSSSVRSRSSDSYSWSGSIEFSLSSETV